MVRLADFFLFLFDCMPSFNADVLCCVAASPLQCYSGLGSGKAGRPPGISTLSETPCCTGTKVSMITSSVSTAGCVLGKSRRIK